MRWLYISLFCLSLCLLAGAQNAQEQNAPAPGVIEGNDPLLQPPPLPEGKPSLIGGNIVKVDPVKNTVVVRPFGGKDMKVHFDERTRIFRDGAETTQLALRKHSRVYVDTLLDGGRVFAKSIRVETQGRLADARGRLVRFDQKKNSFSVLDELSSQPVVFSVDSSTVVRRGEQNASLSELLPGSLVAVHFAPESAARGIARQITIYATPGSSFHFAGRVTFLDLRSGVLALMNRSDDRSYEIHLDRGGTQHAALGIGSEVAIEAVFDGSRYVARTVSVNRASAE